jgi:NADPH:quinone reductase
LVKLAYAGVNFVDLYQRQGRYPDATLPMHLGLEGAGIVQVAKAGGRFKTGDRVAFCTGVQGAYADAVLIDEDCLVPVPTALSLKSAAAALEQGLTAHMLMHKVARLAPNSLVLVHAGAGGVGGLLVQMLLAAGHRVLATASDAEKRAWLSALGATALAYQAPQAGAVDQQNWREQAWRLSAEKGVDVVFDSIGLDTFAQSIAVSKDCGHVVLFGAASGQPAPIDVMLLMQKSLTVSRPRIGHYFSDVTLLRTSAAQLFDALIGNQLALRIHAQIPLAEAALAHQQLASRITQGKIILEIDGNLQ